MHSTGCGTPPRSSPASARSATPARRRSCACRSTTSHWCHAHSISAPKAIIAPMINDADDARHFAAAAKYPPLGERSWGPLRAMALQAPRTAPADYLREANEGTLTLAMIETATALGNVDTIAATPGIDGLFVGPYDLATALSGGKAQDIAGPAGRTAPSTKSAPPRKRPGKFPASIAGMPSAPWRWRSAASASSPPAAITATLRAASGAVEGAEKLTTARQVVEAGRGLYRHPFPPRRPSPRTLCSRAPSARRASRRGPAPRRRLPWPAPDRSRI